MANLIYRILLTLFYAILYPLIGWGIYAGLAKWLTWENTNPISGFRNFSRKRPKAPKVIAGLIILILSILWVDTTVETWRTEIEPALTFEAIAKKFVPVNFLKLLSIKGTLIAKPQLEIQMELINEHIIDLQSDKKKWTKESLEGKYQYIIGISNKSSNDIEDLKVDFQFPFFVNYQEIIEERKVSGRSIEAPFTRASASPTLSVERMGKPTAMNYTVRVHRISPKGILKILFVFEKSGISVKDIPPPGSQPARLLKSGKREFIHGTYTYKQKVFEIYYPIEIRQDKSIFLGPSKNKIPPNAMVVFALGPGVNTQNAKAYTDSGDTHYDNREYEKALKDYDKAININSKYARAYNNRGIVFLKIQKNYNKAIFDFSEAININPEVAGYYSNRANAYSNRGDYNKAISDYNQFIVLSPDQAKAYNDRGNAYADKGQHDQAMGDYNTAIELDPKFAEAYSNRGVEYEKRGYSDLAIADFNEAIRLNPEYAAAYNNRGISFKNRGELDKAAVSDFNRAININGMDAKAYYNRANVHAKKGEYNKTISDFNEAIRLNPEYVDAYNNRGNAYRNRGEHDLGISDLNRALKIDPGYAPAYNNRGNAYRDKGEYDRAIADFNEAIRLNPEYADAYNNRGNAYHKKGDQTTAIADYNQAIAKSPKYALAYYNKALSCEEVGRLNEAVEAYKKFIEYTSPQNSLYIRYAKQRLKDLEKF